MHRNTLAEADQLCNVGPITDDNAGTLPMPGPALPCSLQGIFKVIPSITVEEV